MEKDNVVKKGDLIVPVYLNQRIVFDLLAMREDGISCVTQVLSTEQTGSVDSKRYGVDFGLSKALSSLLKINISADRTRSDGTGTISSTDEEKIHTPASLFYRLRRTIIDEGYLTILTSDSSANIEPYQIVEFEAELKRNPLLETIDSLSSIIEIASVFEENAHQKGKQMRLSDNEKALKKTKHFSEKLRSGDSVDMVAYGIEGNQNALITLETEYLNDPSMADLVDGKFKIIGKVIRTVESEESISLLRKSAFSVIPEKALNDIFGSFETATKEFNMPSLRLKVEGPAFQVIPIAIFA